MEGRTTVVFAPIKMTRLFTCRQCQFSQPNLELSTVPGLLRNQNGGTKMVTACTSLEHQYRVSQHLASSDAGLTMRLATCLVAQFGHPAAMESWQRVLGIGLSAFGNIEGAGLHTPINPCILFFHSFDSPPLLLIFPTFKLELMGFSLAFACPVDCK